MTLEPRFSARARRSVLGALVPLLLAGCAAVGPDYVAPEPSMPDQWQADLLAGFEAGDSNIHRWWTTLEDPILNSLIERAASGNLSLQAAFARVKAARSQRGIATGERYPDLNGTGGATRDRVSEGVVPTMPPGPSRTDWIGAAGMDGSWEVDLWGRISRSIESADAGLEASYEDYRDVLVLLLSDVAFSYVEVRTLQERIRSATNNVKSQRGTRDYTQNRLDAGIAPELDVRQAELNLGVTEATLPALRSGLAQTIYRLSVLLGEHPSTLLAELAEPVPVPHPSQKAFAGVPADLLRQRPDIRRAERELAAQTARIGLVTAELYPRFSLNGSFGVESTADLLDTRNRVWSFTPFVQWNLFDGGRIRNAIGVEDALTEEALLRYEQTVLFALEDVESSMVAYIEEQNRRAFLEGSVTSARRAVELVKVLYETGLTDFQNVLDTERSLFTQEDQLAVSHGRVVQNLISVYRALGGGWDPDTPQLADEISDAEEVGEPIL